MTREELQQLKKEHPFTPVSDLVYQALYREIVTLKLLPGTKLNELHLAKALEISRSPVKTAFDKLTEDGLLTKTGGRQPFVTPVGPLDCLQICQARVSIEGSAAYLAAKNMTDQQLSQIKTLEKEYKELIYNGDLLAAVHNDHQFHTIIVEAAENPYLLEMYNCIQSKILHYRCYSEYLLKHQSFEAKLKHHSRCHSSIVSALSLGFSETAKAEITYDIEGMRDVFSGKNM